MHKWTQEEVARLRELKAQGLDNEHVGRMLGRTNHGIGAKLRKLARGQIIRNVKAWSPQEIELLRTLRDNHRMHWTEIGKRLGRPAATVYDKYKYLQENVPSGLVAARLVVPERTAAEWQRRKMAQPRDLTAQLCGDPLPGFSALERRT